MTSPPPISGERFFSRRSMVMSRNGIVASSHPLATMAGVRILMQGGNAFDAHGSLSLAQVLQPAIELASAGFPVSEMMARGWQRAVDNTREFPNTTHTFAPTGRAPRAGEMFCNPDFARTLKRIAHEGRDAFYLG